MPWSAILDGLGTTATVIAVTVAVATYRRSENDKRKAQARLVYAVVVDTHHYATGDLVPLGTVRYIDGDWVTPSPANRKGEQSVVATLDFWEAEIEIHNDSTEPISSVFCTIRHLADPDLIVRGVSIPTMRPGELSTHALYLTDDPSPSRHINPTMIEVGFWDSSGVRWRRDEGRRGGPDVPPADKVDRRAVRRPTPDGYGASVEAEAPSTVTQHRGAGPVPVDGVWVPLVVCRTSRCEIGPCRPPRT